MKKGMSNTALLRSSHLIALATISSRTILQLVDGDC
jgi:hypothetical protein